MKQSAVIGLLLVVASAVVAIVAHRCSPSEADVDELSRNVDAEATAGRSRSATADGTGLFFQARAALTPVAAFCYTPSRKSTGALPGPGGHAPLLIGHGRN